MTFPQPFHRRAGTRFARFVFLLPDRKLDKDIMNPEPRARPAQGRHGPNRHLTRQGPVMNFILLYLLYALTLSFALWRKGVQPGMGPENRTRGTDEKLKRILVIGATGGTGQELVRQLLDRGHKVTAFVRNRSKLKIEHPMLTVVQGNVLDYDSVEKAVRGHGAVLSALGHKRFFYPARILSEGTRNLLRAMEKNDVLRLVCASSLGIGSSAGRLGLYYTFFTIPVILPFYFWDKARQEKLIAGSHTRWTIVRPGLLTDKPAAGEYRHGPDAGSYIWSVRIPRADVAGFMIDQITDDTYLNTAVGVAGRSGKML